MPGFGAIGEFPVGGPPQPISGTWSSTESDDALAVLGGLVGGAWHSAETDDAFAALGAVSSGVTVSGIWNSTERHDYFTADGLSYDFGEPVYTETIQIFGWLLDKHGNNPFKHWPMDPNNCSPQSRRRRK